MGIERRSPCRRQEEPGRRRELRLDVGQGPRPDCRCELLGCKSKTVGGAKATTCFSSTANLVRPSTERARRIIFLARSILAAVLSPIGSTAPRSRAKNGRAVALRSIAFTLILPFPSQNP